MQVIDRHGPRVYSLVKMDARHYGNLSYTHTVHVHGYGKSAMDRLGGGPCFISSGCGFFLNLPCADEVTLAASHLPPLGFGGFASCAACVACHDHVVACHCPMSI